MTLSDVERASILEDIHAGRLDVGLEEVAGQAPPPDLVEAILLRHGARQESPRRTRWWLAAAVVVFGAAVTWAIASRSAEEGRDSRRDMPGPELSRPERPARDSSTDDELPRSDQDKELPPHRDVTNRAEIEALPRDTVHVRGHLLVDADLAALARLPALRYLDLSRCKLTDGCFDRIARLHKVERLQLNGQSVRGRGLARLITLPNLSHLELRRSKIDSVGLAELKNLPALRCLDISHARGVTDAGLQHVLKLTALRHLELAGNGQLGEGVLLKLGALRELRHLGVAGIQGRMRFATVGEVFAGIEIVTGDAVGVDDRVLAVVAGKMPRLQSLDVGDCVHLTDRGVRELAKLRELRSIDLTRCTKVSAGVVRDLIKRRRCRLLGLPMADSEILRTVAAEQPDLVELRLTGRPNLDLNLSPLGKLAKLRVLVIIRANVRAGDILAMWPCRRLEYIRTVDCQRTGWNELVGKILVTSDERDGQYVKLRR